jgi:hypothetical protein
MKINSEHTIEEPFISVSMHFELLVQNHRKLTDAEKRAELTYIIQELSKALGLEAENGR